MSNANIEMDAITQLFSDIHALFSTLASRIEKLEQNVEQNILKHLDKGITDTDEHSLKNT